MPKFRRRPFFVQARRVKESEEMAKTMGSNFVVKPGDWILGEDTDRQTVCQDRVFRELYEPVDEEGEREMED